MGIDQSKHLSNEDLSKQRMSLKNDKVFFGQLFCQKL